MFVAYLILSGSPIIKTHLPSMLSPGSSCAPGLWQEGLLGGGLGPEEGDQTPEVSPLSRLRRHLVQGENLQRHSGPGEGAASMEKTLFFLQDGAPQL